MRRLSDGDVEALKKAQKLIEIQAKSALAQPAITPIQTKAPLKKATAVDIETIKPNLLGQNDTVWTKSFYETTHLHGFSFIQHSTSWWEGLLWYFLVICFLCIMTKDLYSLYGQYSDQATATEVKLQYEKNLHPLITTMCMPLISKDFLKEVDGARKWPDVETISSILSKFQTKKAFLDSELHEGLLPVVHYLLGSLMTGTEIVYLNAKTDIKLFSYGGATLEFNTSVILDEFLQEKGISTTELSQMFETATKQFLRVTLESQTQRDLYTRIAWSFLARLSFVSGGKICFMFNITDYPKVESVSDSLYFSARLPEKAHRSKSEVKMDFQGDPETNSNFGEAVAVRGTSGSDNAIISEIRGHYIALPFVKNKKGKQCLQHKSKHQCYTECRVKLVHMKCDCIPFSGSLGYPQAAKLWKKEYAAEICTLNQYLTCGLEIDGSDDADCIGECLNSCDLWTYGMTMKSSDPWTNGTRSNTRFSFYYTSPVYPEFREYMPYTIEKMMSDLGGTIGLWMGASFLSIIHVVIFFTKRCKKFSIKSAQKICGIKK